MCFCRKLGTTAGRRQSIDAASSTSYVPLENRRAISERIMSQPTTRADPRFAPRSRSYAWIPPAARGPIRQETTT